MYFSMRKKTKIMRARIAVLLAVVFATVFSMSVIAFAAPEMLWGDGVLVSAKAGSPYDMLQMIPDGKGNVFMCWGQRESDSPNASSEMYAQKLGPDGSKLWANPVMFSKAPNYSWFSQVSVSDDGIVTVWTDNRNKRKPDVYAQKISADGKKLWGDNGMAVYAGAGAQEIRSVVDDSAGGVIVVWKDDERPGLYMQRVSSSGSLTWQEGGVSINDLTGIEVDDSWPETGSQQGDWINVVPDGTGGLYLNWNDLKQTMIDYEESRSESFKGQDGNLFVQRVDGNGKKVWPTNLKISLNNMTQDSYSASQLAVLDDGSAILAWSMPLGAPVIQQQATPDSFSGYPNPNVDYYVARILSDGTLAWDYSKPLFKMRGEVKQDKISRFGNITPMPVKGGILFFEEKSEMSMEEQVVERAEGSIVTSEKAVETATKLISKSLDISKLDFDGKTVWKKRIKSNKTYVGPIASYWSFGQSVKATGSDSFFLASSEFGENGIEQPSSTTVSKFSAETGNELWQPGGISVPVTKGALGPMFEPDGKGGLFMGWRVGSDPKPLSENTSSSPKAFPGGFPEYRQSDIYAQHIVDDGSEWSDIPIKDWSYSHVKNLAKMSAVSGYGNGEFRPDNSITRAEFTKMVVLALNVKTGAKQAQLGAEGSDLKGHWSAQYIEAAVSSGTMQGYTDGTYRPDVKITRAEAAAMICRAKGLKVDARLQDFNDVPKGHWAFSDIEAMHGLGIVEGYGDGSFRPANRLTRAESAKMIDLIAGALK